MAWLVAIIEEYYLFQPPCPLQCCYPELKEFYCAEKVRKEPVWWLRGYINTSTYFLNTIGGGAWQEGLGREWAPCDAHGKTEETKQIHHEKLNTVGTGRETKQIQMIQMLLSVASEAKNELDRRPQL